MAVMRKGKGGFSILNSERLPLSECDRHDGNANAASCGTYRLI
jgi:hypothetical protein